MKSDAEAEADPLRDPAGRAPARATASATRRCRTLPLYIGKSTRLRSRVLSHFAADHSSDRELSLSQQVRRIEWIATAGEIGALLKEAELVKRLQPTHNRQLRRNREPGTWRLATDIVGDWRLELVHAADLDFGRRDDLYGFFRTRREATNWLRALARDHALCPPLLGLEKPRRCALLRLPVEALPGACHGGESPGHALRLIEALHALKVEHWTWLARSACARARPSTSSTAGAGSAPPPTKPCSPTCWRPAARPSTTTSTRSWSRR